MSPSGHQAKSASGLEARAVVASSKSMRQVVLTGNPNCGKTTLFNALTGLRAKVGNYAGVTVERKEGRLQGLAADSPVAMVLDLPGAYSLASQSLDESVARDVLLGRLPEVPIPDLVVVVVDASNLERNLYFLTQVLELGFPTLVALNMMDVAAQQGIHVDPVALATELGIPVFPVVASTRQGLGALRRAIASELGAVRPAKPHRLFPTLPPVVLEVAADLGQQMKLQGPASMPIALLRLMHDGPAEESGTVESDLERGLELARRKLEVAGIDWRTVLIEARYRCVADICRKVVQTLGNQEMTLSDRLDRVVTHKVYGLILFFLLMALMFQSIFGFARLPMDLLSEGVSWLGAWVQQVIPPGDLQSLVVDGVIAGVGAVVVFLPQICLLFLFLGLLEDTGYMARAAFLMDGFMGKVGLHGRSFIPMLSSFACAIPGIMSARVIENPKDRLATIMVAPLMSCSARMPVYALLIAACIPEAKVLGFIRLPGLVLLLMYLLGVTMALVMAWFFKKILLKGATPVLIMELPPYKRPTVTLVFRHMWDRSRLFLKQAGTVILGINILLWFLASYPKNGGNTPAYEMERAQLQQNHHQTPQAGGVDTISARLQELDRLIAGERLRYSFAGRLGRLIEPMIVPLGFDWKIGIGIVASFAAREVFVSTMSVVYNVGTESGKTVSPSLIQSMKQQQRADGRPTYSTLTGLSLMVFYVLALQCVSTMAVVRRETNSWKWPLVQWLYMGGLAWSLSFLTYQGGRLLGFE